MPLSDGARLQGMPSKLLGILLAAASTTGVLSLPAFAVAQEPTPAHIGDEVCVSSEVEGAVGRVCARRDRFGAAWTTELTDTADDGQRVEARVSLVVADAPDPSATVTNDEGAGATISASGDFSPRVGSALDEVAITTCVVIRFGRDRCSGASADLPQLRAQATPAQSERLEELVFDMPVERFMEEWESEVRTGVDGGFDWSSDGCSGGPLGRLLQDLIADACVRHDFGYRNLGVLLLDPTDDMRRRVDEQLAADAIELGQAWLADGLRESLQYLAGPVFYGDDLASLWGVPDFVTTWLRRDDEVQPTE